MDTTKSKRIVQDYLQHEPKFKRKIQEFSGTWDTAPETLFPLLCPAREADWIPGWDCELIYTTSGYAEDKCVFRTEKSNSAGDGIWMFTGYEPNEYVEFVKFQQDMLTYCRITLTSNDNGTTTATWKTTLTALTEKGNKELEKVAAQNHQSNAFYELVNHYIKKGKIKHYKATDPKHFIDFIDQKKRNFEKILPELLIKQKFTNDRNDAEVYIGYKGIMNLLLELIKDADKGDETVFFSADIDPMNKEIQDFFTKYTLIKMSKGTKTKGLAPIKLKHLFEDSVKKGHIKMKYTNKQLPPCATIAKDKMALYTWGEKPIGYLIHSKQLAQKYRNYFYSIWNKSK